MNIRKHEFEVWAPCLVHFLPLLPHLRRSLLHRIFRERASRCFCHSNYCHIFRSPDQKPPNASHIPAEFLFRKPQESNKSIKCIGTTKWTQFALDVSWNFRLLHHHIVQNPLNTTHVRCCESFPTFNNQGVRVITRRTVYRPNARMVLPKTVLDQYNALDKTFLVFRDNPGKFIRSLTCSESRNFQ